MAQAGIKLSEDCTFTRTFGGPDALPGERFMPEHRHVLTYWDSARQRHRALLNADFDPYQIRHALPHVVLWEVDSTGGYRCRLSGTEVDENTGSSLKGVLLADIPCALIGEAVEEFGIVRDRLLPCFVDRTMAWAGKPYRYYRHLLLPLVDDRERAKRLLSVLTFHDMTEAPVPRSGAPANDRLR